ncbi:hypothetical protein M0R45_017762 [Rubus argutus]|uniref:Uncharacterized protein n=1 Tax=Rubus argutus TaxID=59490 RepID=A0AAW1XWN3_RUBAR
MVKPLRIGFKLGGGLHEAPNVPLATDGEIESLLDDLYPGLGDMNEDSPNVNAPNPLPPDDVRSFNELLEEANKEIYPGCQGDEENGLSC